ncbi:hypothetical protein ABSL23_02220 [Halobacterium sp. NMX12-1]|uniref:Uncharacterized protein n=1 Tax=Halobacterium sp. NMX12-1 TaxID=3166650 RepID=A0AAU8CFM9_9EURY
MSDNDSSERSLDEIRETFRDEFLQDMEEHENRSEEATEFVDALTEENPSPDKIGETFGSWVDNLTSDED